jgi:glycosyltransferase involved in cell wall biosynthesis
MSFDGDWLSKRGCGGSESALINLSKNVKQLHPDYEVIVYNGTRKETQIFDGVIYKSINSFYSEKNSFNADAFISLREIYPFTLKYLDAKKKVLWSQDNMLEHDIQLLAKAPEAIKKNIDMILAISEYAKNDLQPNFNIPIKLQRNGYNQELNSPFLDPREREPIAVYTSTPFRGLDVLSDCWPQILEGCRKRNINPTLKVYGGMDLYNQSDIPFMGLYNKISNLPNAQIMRSIPQVQLYEELKKSKVMLYPNHYIETGAMAVLEALACGVWVVTTDLGALGEQVIDGMNGNLISGDAHSFEYKGKFIHLAIDALCDKTRVPYTRTPVVFSWKEQAEKLLENIFGDR